MGRGVFASGRWAIDGASDLCSHRHETARDASECAEARSVEDRERRFAAFDLASGGPRKLGIVEWVAGDRA